MHPKSTIEYRVILSRFWQTWKDMVIFKTLRYYGIKVSPVLALVLFVICCVVFFIYLFSHVYPHYYGAQSVVVSGPKVEVNKGKLMAGLKKLPERPVNEAGVVSDGKGGDKRKPKRIKRDLNIADDLFVNRGWKESLDSGIKDGKKFGHSEERVRSQARHFESVQHAVKKHRDSSIRNKQDKHTHRRMKQQQQRSNKKNKEFKWVKSLRNQESEINYARKRTKHSKQ